MKEGFFVVFCLNFLFGCEVGEEADFLGGLSDLQTYF